MSLDTEDGRTPHSIQASSDCSPAEISVDLEQKFEDDFSQHIKKRNKKQRLKLGAVGAVTGGVMGLAAAPTVLPGLALAAIAGGAGGYQWAKRWGRPSTKKGQSATSSTHPRLRRLTYLVKWARLQLLEYEDQLVHYQAAVVDEVVREFSPWIQQLYLLKSRGGLFEGNSEAYEIFKHLAPLFFFLQHRSSMEATIQSVAYVSKAFDDNCPDATCADRCFVVFPSILETISVLDRLGESVHAQLSRAVSFQREESHPVHRARHRQRLQQIVVSICSVLHRAEVIEAMADRSHFDHSPRIGSEAVIQHDADSSPSEETHGARFQVLPEGAEDEPGLAFEDANEYFSVSGESDAEGTGRAASFHSARLEAVGEDVHALASMKQRLDILPNGGHDHSWATFDSSRFDVRSLSYLSDRQKLPSGSAMLELLHVDFIRIGPNGPVMKVTEHPDFYPAHHWNNGDDRFLLVQNWVFPPFQAIITAAVNPDAAWVTDPTCPQALLWKRFLQSSDTEKADMCKFITSVEKGPWMVRRAAVKKPLLVSKRLKTDVHYMANKYAEVVFEVCADKKSQALTAIVMRGLSYTQLTCAMLLEARHQEELPENILVCFAANQVSTTKLCCNLEKDECC